MTAYLFKVNTEKTILSVPARWGLQQTTRAPGSDKALGQWSFGPFTGGLTIKYLNIIILVIATYKRSKKKNGPYILTHF